MKSVSRFSSRVEDYARYRPGYPSGLLDILKSNCDLDEQSVIADIGSGTGLLAELFLQNGNQVVGVEPNDLMRAKGEDVLQHFANFRSVAATAECTTLPDSSVDLITAGQAFHWFDRQAARREFVRILKPNGWVALIWNARQVDSTAFLRDYEALLLRYSADYAEVRHENVESEVANFFAPQPMKFAILEQAQQFDFDSLKGRLCSSSYVPETGSANLEKMLSGLEQIFGEHSENGVVNFEYDTRIYYGQLEDPEIQ